MSQQATGPTRTPQIIIRSLIHDLDLNRYILELRFYRVDGGKGTLLVPRSAAMKPHDVMHQLLDAGALLPPDKTQAAKLVRTALTGDAHFRKEITRKGGWHGSSFVTPRETFGPRADTLSFAGARDADPPIWRTDGTLPDWRDGLTPACSASSFLTFALSIGFAAPLLDVLGLDEGVLFHLSGASSTGKTLCSRALQSEGGQARDRDLPSYGVTPRAVEEICHARSDFAVVFDEEGRTRGTLQQRREIVREVAFMIPSGRGITRSERVGRNLDLPNLSWRVLGITSGENPLEDVGTPRLPGERLRHIDIHVPPRAEGGIFDRLNGGTADIKTTARELATQVAAVIAGN